ncbi:MAG: vanadium-dependent haloperoxidase [Cellulosilyticaceae bacterium]
MSCTDTGYYTPYNEWDKMLYNQEPFTSMGEMPAGGSWPLNFFKRTADGRFTTIAGEPIAFKIKTPDYFDKFWQKEMQITMNACNNITEEQKKIATYWGTGEPHNQLIPILQILINTYKLQVIEAARLYDLVNRAYNDAAVICWHFKYSYQVPRVVQYCKDFKTFLPTPQHPSYPAGHSVMPACVIQLLAHFFPAEKEKLYRLLEECSYSRIYAGVHYPIDAQEGEKLGIDIAEKILEQIKGASDQYGAWIDKVYDQYLDAPIIPDYKQYFIK